jgi:hypothetical protein
MADKKISALTSATTPLAGTEVLPIVQGGATVKVAVSDLTAGRAISATQLTLTAGNLIPANGYGIDFSATPGTGTSELFADYEEGTWTPTFVSLTIISGTPTYTSTYTKVGRTVYFSIYITGGGYVTSVANTTYINNLPFTAAGNHVCNTADAGTALSYGSGLIQIGNVFTPSFANKTNVVITGTYAV